MSSLDRFSPPLASAGDDSREPYARVPSPRRDDYGVSGAGEDLSAWTRGRTPEESDRRGKRRRSPSPSGGGGGGGRGADTYIPSYHRDRSPPAYRDRREHGAAYGGPDRYDTRTYGGRDSHDQFSGGPGYDRRGPPPPRSQLRPPQELPYLATFAYYRDYMREEDPRTFDDKDKLEEQYKKYRASFFHKNNRSFFDEVKEMNWCKEKYGLAEELVEQRKALRSKGREGRLDTFAQSLENGEFDDLTFEGKPPADRSPGKRNAKLDATEQPIGDSEDATMNNNDNMDDKPKVKAEDDGDASAKTEDIDEDAKVDEKSAAEDSAIKTEATEGDANSGEDAKVANVDEANGKLAGEDTEARKGDEDSILIPGSTNTLFIKSISPEISRADLEAHCKQVEGFDYVALGEPNPTKKFHRIGWVVFTAGSNMESAVEKLCESKINDFTLHMTLSDKQTYQRLRQTPSAMASPDRIRDSLEHVKKIVARLELENDNDTRGTAAIEKRLQELSVKGEKTEGVEDETAKIERAEKTERQTLDLYLQYLRSVFHTCYYCTTTHDFPEELVRKCVRHVRRPLNSPGTGKNRKEQDVAWVKNFDEKVLLMTDRESVDPLDYGGESQQEELAKLCQPHIIVEDESKYRCKTCKKLFKAGPFVEKHILNKHPEVVGDRLEELKYFNNYVLDPAHPTHPSNDSPHYSNNPNHPANSAFYNSGMASTFGAFNQMFNPAFNYGMGMMALPSYDPYAMFPPMGAQGFNGFGGSGFAEPLSGGARTLGDRIGGRQGGYGMDGPRHNKRARRDFGPAPGGPPPPPPKGAKIDPRAGRLHAYTDLDGPPASGGGGDLDMLDY